MSRWTHVVGTLYVETYTENKNIGEYVTQLLKDAPKITGSERDCDIFVNPLSGHNTSTNADCEHCQYGETIVHLEEGGFQCDAEKEYECPSAEYQTCVAITLVGDLRDRDKSTTTKEINEFLRYIQNLDKGFDIDYASIFVRDEWDTDYILKIEYDEDNLEDKGKFVWIAIQKGEKND